MGPTPLLIPAVVHHGEERIGLIRYPVSGKATAHVVLGKADTIYLAPDIRLVLFQPEQLGGRVVGRFSLAQFAGEGLRLADTPQIGPDDTGVQRFVASIKDYRPVGLAAHGDTRDLSAPDPRLSQTPSYACQRQSPPLIGVLL